RRQAGEAGGGGDLIAAVHRFVEVEALFVDFSPTPDFEKLVALAHARQSIGEHRRLRRRGSDLDDGLFGLGGGIVGRFFFRVRLAVGEGYLGLGGSKEGRKQAALLQSAGGL